MKRRDWLSAAFGAGAVAAAIFAIGGATRWAQSLVAVIAAAALVPLVTSRRVFGRISPLVALILIAIGLTTLQLLPLPHGVVSWLNPTGAALRDDGAALVGTAPAATITLDVPATVSALATLIVLLAVALLVLRMSASETGRFRVLATIAALCGLAAIVTGIHWLVGAEKLYGIYRPLQAGPRTLAPLLSPNHFGCLMAVGAVLSVALALYRRQKSWVRASWLFSAASCVLAMLNTWSRGAAVALVLGGFVTLAVRVAQRLAAHDTPRRRRAGFLTSSLPIGVVAACTIFVVIYAGAAGVAQQLTDTKLNELNAPRSKFAAWRSSTELIEESPWIGIGRGALEPVFTRVHPASAYVSFTHVENEYLQSAIDWGVPGALLLGMAALWLVVTALRRWRDGPLAAGALGAMAVVMLQSNVDFGVELLGIAVPITAVAATLAYVPVREASGRKLAIARGARAVHIAALVVVAAALLSSATMSVEEDHRAIAHRPKLTLADLQGPLQRHPLDFYSYELAAVTMIRDHDARAVRVLNHAMLLHPTDAGLHLVAARLLFDTGHQEQATIEYAAAVSFAKDPRKLIVEIVGQYPPAVAATALPISDASLEPTVGTLHAIGHPDVAVAWLARVLERQPQMPRACELLYNLAGANADLDVVRLVAQRCGSYQASNESRIALAKQLLAKHAAADIVSLLADVETWQSPRDEKGTAWLLLCDAYLSLTHWDDAKRCLRRLDASGLLPPDRASEIAGRLEQARALQFSGSGSATP